MDAATDPAGTAAPAVPAARPRLGRRILVGTLLLALLAVLGFGCTSTVTPPARVLDPVRVMVIADGMHQGLLLPRPEGGYVEFGFGEWSFYALGRDGWYRTVPAMLWPTRGTLSRRLVAAADPAAARRELHWAELQDLAVERALAERLRARLQAEFAAGAAELVTREAWRMQFVPVDRSFWWPHTCADAAAGWLEQLGCSVSWVPIRAGLRVR